MQTCATPSLLGSNTHTVSQTAKTDCCGCIDANSVVKLWRIVSLPL